MFTLLFKFSKPKFSVPYVSNVQGVPSGHTLSYVDLDFYCCIVIPTLPRPVVKIWQKRPGSMLRWLEHRNPSQPTQAYDQMGHPVEFRYRQYVPPGNYDGGSREYLKNVSNYRREVAYDLWAMSRVRSVFVVRALLVPPSQ